MKTTNKLAAAALLGLFTASVMTASPAFAGEDSKSSCNGKDNAKMEKPTAKQQMAKRSMRVKAKIPAKARAVMAKMHVKVTVPAQRMVASNRTILLTRLKTAGDIPLLF